MEAESRIAIESDADVVTARQRARELAGELELSSTDQTLLATAISEVARNITTYATRGEVTLRVVHDGNGRRASRSSPPTTARASRTSSARCRTATRPAAGLGSGCRARAGWSTSSRSRAHRSRARRCGSSNGRARPSGACVCERRRLARRPRARGGGRAAGGRGALGRPRGLVALRGRRAGRRHRRPRPRRRRRRRRRGRRGAVPPPRRRGARRRCCALPRGAALDARRGRHVAWFDLADGRPHLDRDRQRRGPPRPGRPRRAATPSTHRPCSAGSSAGRCRR